MSREELEARIARVERADSRRLASQAARDVIPYQTMLDKALRGRFVAALEAWDLDASAARAPSHLGVGASWLLLHAGGKEGRVARLLADARAPAGAADGLPSRSLAPVLRALRGIAAKHCRAFPAELAEPYVGVAGADRASEAAITGDSLQLSAAVALLSRALGQAPLASCAATARVLLDGRLAKVTHVAEKVAALTRDFPEVRMVIVAEDQDIAELDVGMDIEIVPLARLEEALPHFGLDLRGLRDAPLDEHRMRVRSLEIANRRDHTPSEWQTLCQDALESAAALAVDYPDESARCRAWSALFAVHGGDPRLAAELVDGVDASVLQANPELDVEMHIVRATGAIDRNSFDEAVTAAGVAVTMSEMLEPSHQKRVRGRALGTLGRAHMHAGRLSEAEPALRAAVDHHRANARDEVAQSLSYLATCLRLARRLEEALAATDEALEDVRPRAERLDAAKMTVRFLRLERGRILLAMSRYDDAEDDLLSVTQRQAPGSYPRLGAERSLVRLRLASGHHEAAHAAFVRCLEAARIHLAGHAATLAQVAAVGVGEGLLGLELTPSEREAAADVWKGAFGETATPEHVNRILANWIF